MPATNSTLLSKLRPITRPWRVKNLLGRRFGRLTVIELAGSIRGLACWRCVCECGNTCYVARTSHLTGGYTISCGCFQKTHSITHGMSRSDEYQIWASMKDRCFGPSSGAYKYYGARGITVCADWCGQDGFQRFLSDVGRRPSKQHSLDRIDVNGNYEPGNVRWATTKEQSRNKRYNRFIEVEGISKTAKEWSHVSGIDSGTISSRIQRGWAPSDAIFLPLMSRMPRGSLSRSHT
jgi:hypothetical protein